MQAGTATLNPTSLPFFPRAAEREPSTLTNPASRSSSSSTASGSDYRSVHSSPSPPAELLRRQVRGEDTPVAALDLPAPVSVSIPVASSLSTTTGSTRSSVLTEHTSSSPTSSTGSQRGEVAMGDHMALFDHSLKSSRVVNDLLERLVRCEFSIKDIQRDMGEVNRKLNVLIDRSIATTVNNATAAQAAQDAMQFRNPFAASTPIITPVSASPGQFPLNGSSRGPPPKDDITQMAQQISSLNSSVSQLLALQTQQQQQRSQSLAGPAGIGLGLPPAINHAAEQLSAGAVPPHPQLLGRPGPGPRTPNPPMRTWSQGSLDIRPPPENALINRPDPRAGAAKRGSVVGLLRRDSSGMLDVAGDNWAGSSPRDGGPTISKWENLPILPELLRSIAKYGVGPPNKIQQRALPFLLRGADIIAQAPPTQERIAAYVIPAIQIALTCIANKPITRGPIVVIISTTVDQATQAQRMIRDLGGPIGVRSALGVGSAVGSNEVANEIRLMQQNMPHVLCGTPQKLHAMFTNAQPLPASEVRLLVLDEVDQLIARNLHEFVFNIVKLLPPPRSRPLPPANNSPVPGSQLPFGAGPFEPGTSPSIASPFQTQPRRFPSGVVSPGLSESPSSVGPIGSAPGSSLAPSSSPPPVERQTALFSNTVPQDVLNLATTIQLREPVRVLVRRDGNVTHADTSNGARGLRQFYLYLAFTAGGGRLDGAATPGGGLGIIGSGRGTSSAETAQAREWKLEALADLFDDVEVAQAIVHVGGITALDSVVYKLASRGIDAIPLHGDMAPGAKLAALNKFRATNSHIMRQTTKALVVYDVQVKSPDVFQVPLVINYDLPKAVEEYAHRVAPAISSNYARAGVVVNFVTATGGDVEMLRSIECFYKIKCPEVPMSLRDVI